MTFQEKERTVPKVIKDFNKRDDFDTLVTYGLVVHAFMLINDMATLNSNIKHAIPATLEGYMFSFLNFVCQTSTFVPELVL